MRTKKWLVAIVAVLVAFVSGIMFACKDDPKVDPPPDINPPTGRSEAKEDAKLTLGSSLYFISLDMNNNKPEYLMAASLQGILAQKGKSSIYIITPGDSRFFMQDLQTRYGKTFTEVTDVWQLVNTFKSDITESGYVLFNHENVSVNAATTVSGAKGYLMVDETLENTAKSKGLSKKADMVEKHDAAVANSSNLEEIIFDEYKSLLDNNRLLYQMPSKITCRDYAIATKTFCFFPAQADGEASSLFRQKVYSWTAKNAPVLGYCDDGTEDKFAFISEMSDFSLYNVGTDWSENFSILKAFGDSDTSEIKQSNFKAEKIQPQDGKHYVTLVMSEGNNLQWYQRGFINDAQYFNYNYKNEVPINFGMSARMQTYAPSIMRKLYQTATPKQYFMSGISGAGFANSSTYADIDLFTSKTNQLMKASDLKYVNIFDTEVGAENMDYLKSYAKQDGIAGGIYTAGTDYAAANGSVYWENDKPFVATRELLWRENYRKIAYRLSNYKKDYTKIEGYSVVQFYPFAINSTTLKKFIDELSDDVVIVNLDSFMTMIKENVDKSDVPELDDKNKANPADFDNYPGIIDDYFDVEAMLASPISNKLAYGFDTDKDGFTFVKGDKAFDNVQYWGSDGNKKSGSVQFSGNDGGLKDNQGNGWMYQKIKLPDLPDLKLSVSFKGYPGGDTDGRVRFVEENKKITTVKDWTTYNANKWYTEVIDIAAYRNKTVVVAIEQNDSGDSILEYLHVDDVSIYSYNPNEKVLEEITVKNIEDKALDSLSVWSSKAAFDKWSSFAKTGASVNITDSVNMAYSKADGTKVNPYAYVYNKVTITENFAKFTVSGTGYIGVSLIMYENGNLVNHILFSGEKFTPSGTIYADLTKLKGQKAVMVVQLGCEGAKNSVTLSSIEFTAGDQIDGVEKLAKQTVNNMPVSSKTEWTNGYEAAWKKSTISPAAFYADDANIFVNVASQLNAKGVADAYAYEKMTIGADHDQLSVKSSAHEAIYSGKFRVRAMTVDTWAFTTLIDWTAVERAQPSTIVTGAIPAALRGKTVVLFVEFDFVSDPMLIKVSNIKSWKYVDLAGQPIINGFSKAQLDAMPLGNAAIIDNVMKYAASTDAEADIKKWKTEGGELSVPAAIQWAGGITAATSEPKAFAYNKVNTNFSSLVVYKFAHNHPGGATDVNTGKIRVRAAVKTETGYDAVTLKDWTVVSNKLWSDDPFTIDITAYKNKDIVIFFEFNDEEVANPTGWHWLFIQQINFQ